MSNRDGIGRIVALPVVLLALAPAARAGVIVVDPGGSDGAALLQSALDDAADGDIVLVRAGTDVLGPSERFVITGKGLTLVTDEPTPPMLSGLEVSHVFSWQTVTVRGFTLGPVTWDDGPEVPTVFAHDTDGVLWIEDCAIVGRLGAAHFSFGGFDLRDGSPAVQVGNESGPFGTFAFTDAARSFSVTSPVQEGAPGGVDVDGEPGDLVMLLFATDATSYALGGNQGVLVVDPIPIHLLTLGATDANGDLALGFTTPHLPAGLMGITLYLQLLVQSDAGFTLEASSAFVWLDGSL